jgi:hypothetical protein
MARMNSKTRKRIYPILSGRDGEFCAGCNVIGSFQSLCVDHIDNNNRNNELDNLQLMCRKCNVKKNPRRKVKPTNDLKGIQDPRTSMEIQLNRRYEPIFREWLDEQVMRYERIDLRDAIDSGAEITGASIQTIGRYLKKTCSTAGRFQTIDIDGTLFVEFKEFWNPR